MAIPPVRNLRNHDWGESDFSGRDIQVLDTSLRDGLQDSHLRHPTLPEKLDLAERLVRVGVDAIDLAFPAAGGSHLNDAIALARSIPDAVQVACMARTRSEDIAAAADFAQAAGRSVEVLVFVGSSPIRRWVEGWDLGEMLTWMETSVRLALKAGLSVTVGTEHTTETEPDVLRELYRVGLGSGARRACLADTSGAATPTSTANLIGFIKREVLAGFDGVGLDWHGHDDRGLAVACSLVALSTGAGRVHATTLGIGERAGNTPLEQLLLNLKLAGDPRRADLTSVPDLADLASRIFGVPIRPNHPGIGEKAGVTASGIHAAAMRKARQRGLAAGFAYSIVDQGWFGRSGQVRIGPLSGRANVLEVGERLGLETSPALVEAVLAFARQANRILTDQDVVDIAHGLERDGTSSA